MKIQGLQKMTLLDFPGKVACTVFLGGCDLRCPFCHNAQLLDGSAPALLTEEELLSFLQKRRGLLDGVAFTGGEPLLRGDLPELLGRLRALGFAIKLDTNGCHPDALAAVLNAHLVDYVAMDIKNAPDRYSETVGIRSFDTTPVQASLDLLRSGDTDYELRTTVVEELHDEESFRGIATWIRGAKRYFLQCYADRENVLCSGLHAPSEEKLRRYAELVRSSVREVSLRGI